MPERKTPVGGDNRDTDHFKQSKDIFFFWFVWESDTGLVQSVVRVGRYKEETLLPGMNNGSCKGPEVDTSLYNQGEMKEGHYWIVVRK